MRIRLDIPLKLSEITDAIGALPPIIEKTIEYVSTDTRELFPDDLFFALKGEKYDGEDYIAPACEIGAIPVTTVRVAGGVTVKDTAIALLSLAEYYLTRLKRLRSRICITGSVGKTTTKELLRALVKDSFKTHATEGNFNNMVNWGRKITKEQLRVSLETVETPSW